jgi:hypothetical protein
MEELFDINPEINVLETEYKRLLGYPPRYELSGRVRELIDDTRQWYKENGKPWVYIRQASWFELVNGQFTIDGISFNSKRLYDRLINAKAHSAIVVGVSAGRNCEEYAAELWRAEKPDEYFFMEMYGSAVVENLIASTGARICAWVDQQQMAVLPHYSPGYPEWDISEQHKLFDLMGRGKTVLPDEFHVMESGMLNPKKSLFAVFGITKHLDRVAAFSKLIPCENCSLEGCTYRRVPYKRAMQEIEKINESMNGAEIKELIPALNHCANYKINAKALDKWSKERLVLNILDDRSIEAQFRYEGTTCANTGRPLEFIYRVKLGASESQYKIQEAFCLPAPGDTGHTSMCQYIKDGRQLMFAIEREKPLLGKPLNAVLDWNYMSNPAGCYCNPASRQHKWGIVLQVIHYAMVQHEKQNEGSLT